MGYVILALVAGLAAVERKGFLQAMLSRPIILGPLTGWALGDAAGGLLIAPVLELLWLGAVNLGAAVPVHEALATVAVVGGAVLSARHMGAAVTPEIATLAVLVAAPVSILGRVGEREGEIWNQRIASRAEHELATHHVAAAARCNLYGLVASFLVSALLAPAAGALAVLVVPIVLQKAPFLAAPLRVGFYALAALACAAAAKALRARAAPLSFFGAAAATAVLGLVAVLAGRVM